MALILGITKATNEHGAGCSTDATDPALDRFLCGAWEAWLARDREHAVGLLSHRVPGLYPLTVRVDYDVAGFEVVGADCEIIEGARDSSIDEAFAAALSATRRLSHQRGEPGAARSVLTTVLLEVPNHTRVPLAAPEVTASFADVVRAVVGRRPLTPGDHVVDFHVAPIGDRWSVAPVGGAPAGGIVHALLQALRQAGMLADDVEATGGESTGRVSLLVRAPAVR